jgi:hypothetical protein|tara:strand:- start:1346 stop:1699 length:354 start_codon:yes stop_codon:yes gene_type:complete
MASRILGQINKVDSAVDTDLFSTAFEYDGKVNHRDGRPLKITIQAAVETGGANLRAIVVNNSVSQTMILGTMTTANTLYQFEMLYGPGDAVDLQYNGITGPMEVKMIVVESDNTALK